MLNIFSTFPTELKGKKVPKGEKNNCDNSKTICIKWEEKSYAV